MKFLLFYILTMAMAWHLLMQVSTPLSQSAPSSIFDSLIEIEEIHSINSGHWHHAEGAGIR